MPGLKACRPGYDEAHWQVGASPSCTVGLFNVMAYLGAGSHRGGRCSTTTIPIGSSFRLRRHSPDASWLAAGGTALRGLWALSVIPSALASLVDPLCAPEALHRLLIPLFDLANVSPLPPSVLCDRSAASALIRQRSECVREPSRCVMRSVRPALTVPDSVLRSTDFAAAAHFCSDNS